MSTHRSVSAMPTPEHTAKADQFHMMCNQLLEHYISAIGTDMDNYRREHGKSMDATFAHNDITRVLLRSQDLTAGVLAGMVASAILKANEKKRGNR